MTEQLTRARVEGALARANAATEGPWRVDQLGLDGYVILDAVRWRGHTNSLNFGEDRDTAEFVAHARSDVPAMAGALIRVLDLHEPETVEVMAQRSPWDYEGWPTVQVSVCSHCLPKDVRDMVADVEADVNDVRSFLYPCATVRAITGQELGGAENG